MTTSDLKQFLRPKSVAIVGASKTKLALGNEAIRTFRELNFKGKVFAVNPRYEEIESFPCYPSISAIPDPIDVVIFLVSSGAVEVAIHECVEKTVKFVAMFTSGFAEKGDEGKAVQDRIVSLCRANGIRLLGPNTMGCYNFVDQIMLTMSPPVRYLAGDVGIVSQSGATGHYMVGLAHEEEVGLSYMLSTGNQPDINTLDWLEFLIDDVDTNVIGYYFEGMPDGARFESLAAKALSVHKPIIAIRPGVSDAGKRAALSHTASLTGSGKVLELVADRYGITLVNEVDELVNATKAFRSGMRPQGNRAAVIVISGAAGIMFADRLSEFGFQMPALSEETQRRLLEVVPGYCSVRNPVDIGATFIAIPELYKHCLETLVTSGEVDVVIAHVTTGEDMAGMRTAQDIVDVAGRTDKPILYFGGGPEYWVAEVRHFLTKNRIPAFSTLKSTVQSASYLLKYERRYTASLESVSGVDQGRIGMGEVHLPEAAVVTEPEVKQLLDRFGIPVPRGGVAKSVDDCRTLAKGLTYPLVAKVVSRQITHKSDVGGVVFPIADEPALLRAFESIMASAAEHAPTAVIDGALIEELTPGPFLEAIVGVTKDPTFGPVVMCGLGGIYVEVMKDVSQRLAPVSDAEALEMIQELKSYPLLVGVRTGAKYDVGALAKVLAQVSQMALVLGDRWSDFETNPLAVRPEGQGVVALDGLITLDRR